MTKKEIPFNRILIIDDSEVDLFIANTVLKRHKPSLSLSHALNVDSALNMMSSFKPHEVPDLILLDLNFDRQEKQGIDFLKEFRKLHPDQNSEIKIKILTAYAGFKEIKSITKDFSSDEIIQKPFSVEKLLVGNPFLNGH